MKARVLFVDDVDIRGPYLVHHPGIQLYDVNAMRSIVGEPGVVPSLSQVKTHRVILEQSFLIISLLIFPYFVKIC